MREPYQVVVRPLLTEKSVDGAKRSKYTFQVHQDASKVEVAQAIERLFPNVKVGKVNTITVRGKARRTSGYGRARRRPGRTSDWKKAIVTLKQGKIEVFEGL